MFYKQADYPFSIELCILLFKNNTSLFAAFLLLLIVMKAMLAIPIRHSFYGIVFMLRLLLHHALIGLQPPFRKVHLSASFPKGIKKRSPLRANLPRFSVPVPAAAFCTSFQEAERLGPLSVFR